MRTIIAVTLLLLSLAVPAFARAESKQDEEKKRDDDRALDIGVLGGVGIPRPLAIEPVIGFHRTVILGAEYSFLPKTTIANVDTRMWAALGDLRFFPFRGGFFIGLRGGYQELTSSMTLTAANLGSYTESVEMSTWFVNPRIGFFWVWKPFALGIDVGAQIPIATTVTRSSLLGVAAPEVDARITSATDTLGRTVLPTIDLLRLGLVF